MKDKIKLGPAIPHLPVDDAPTSIAFYKEKLGMKVIYDDELAGFGGDDAYFACLGRGNFILVVNWHDDSDYKFTIDVWIDSLADLQSLHEEFTSSEATPTQIEFSKHFNTSTMTVIDPNGHEINFIYDHDDD